MSAVAPAEADAVTTAVAAPAVGTVAAVSVVFVASAEEAEGQRLALLLLS